MYAQGIITLHILLTTLNTTKRKFGSLQEAKMEISKSILTQEPMRRWSTQSTTITSITCQDKEYRDISRWYIGMMIKTNFTTKGIWQEVRI